MQKHQIQSILNWDFADDDRCTYFSAASRCMLDGVLHQQHHIYLCVEHSARIHNNDKRNKYIACRPIFPSVTLHILIEKQESRLEHGRSECELLSMK